MVAVSSIERITALDVCEGDILYISGGYRVRATGVHCELAEGNPVARYTLNSAGDTRRLPPAYEGMGSGGNHLMIVSREVSAASEQLNARNANGELNEQFVIEVSKAIDKLDGETKGEWIRISTIGYEASVSQFAPTSRDMHDAVQRLTDIFDLSVYDGKVRVN